MFEVHTFSSEQLDLRARPDLMARIAADSGGERFKKHLSRTRPAQVEHVSVWDRWWVLVALFGVWTTCWAVRRASGLV